MAENAQPNKPVSPPVAQLREKDYEPVPPASTSPIDPAPIIDKPPFDGGDETH